MIIYDLEDTDMELPKEYDLAIKSTAINANKGLDQYFEVDDGVYLNNKYLNLLMGKMTTSQKEKFKGECTKSYPIDDGQKRVKICSVASSARLAFLKFRSNENIEFEKVLDNQGCKPHLDAYDSSVNEYYECKCHEIVKPHPILLSKDPYERLIKDIFDVTGLKTDDKDNTKIVLSYDKFGIDETKFPKNRKVKYLPTGTYFDFKQFVCHVIGLVGDPTVKEKPTLHYVFFLPDDEYMNGVVKQWEDTFVEYVKELFNQIKGNIKIYNDSFENHVRLEYEIVRVSKVVDIL